MFSLAYLSLLHPAENSFHEAVPATSVVFAGDSSGLNLCLALVQLLLTVRPAKSTLRFHGQDILPDLPAGVAGISGFLDLTLSLPSNEANYDFDVLFPSDPYHSQDKPIEPCWPANPPRGGVYCETSALCHPLVSPTNARSWVGAPPMWLAYGQERMADGVKAVTRQAASDEVDVQFEEYGMMPHIWPVTMPKLPQARMAVERWAAVCLQLRKGTVERSAKRISGEKMDITLLEIKSLLPLSGEEFRRIMREHRDQRQPYVRGATSKAHI